MLREDVEWSKWSDKEIARKCVVAVTMVSDLRDSIFSLPKDSPPRKVRRGKTEYIMNTSKIGKRKPAVGPKAFIPVLSTGNPPRKITFDFPRDNAEAAANTLLTFFDVAFLEELIEVLSEKLHI